MQVQIRSDSNNAVHFFQYKNKKYPIKYEFFQTILLHFPKIGNNDTIPLIDENSDNDIDLTDENIHSFINYVQHQPITINNENLVPLNYLAKKYFIGQLINDTQNYIKKYGIEFVIIIFIDHQEDPNFKSKAYEDFIEENFNDCIQTEKILNLNIQILHRIFHQYTINNGQLVSNQILDFLFKCLNKYRKNASCLFEYVRFNHTNKCYLDLLLDKKYEDVFDTKYLNSSVIHFLHENQSQSQITVNDNENKNQDNYAKFHVGDILFTTRNMSDDKSWLECDGRYIDKDKYGQLYDVLKPTPDEGKLDEHSFDGDHKKIKGNATDGEYFVFLELYEKNSIKVFSTKNIHDDNFQYKIIELPNGKIHRFVNREHLYYLNGEFVIAFLISTDSNNKILYILHAKKPDDDWENISIPINVFPNFEIYYSRNLFHLYFLNNTYVVLFNIKPSDDFKEGFVILYGPSFSSLKMNKYFFSKSESFEFPNIAFGNGKWVIVVYQSDIPNKKYKAIIYYTKDLSLLSPHSKDCNILYQCNDGEKKFYGMNIMYGGGLWVVYGFYYLNNDISHSGIYYFEDPSKGIKNINFDNYTINWNHKLGYCNGIFFFLAANKNDRTLYLFYSANPNLNKENLKIIQLCKETIDIDLEIDNYIFLSYNEHKNIIFINFENESTKKIFSICYTPGFSKRIPYIDSVNRINAYIKASE